MTAKGTYCHFITDEYIWLLFYINFRIITMEYCDSLKAHAISDGIIIANTHVQELILFKYINVMTATICTRFTTMHVM